MASGSNLLVQCSSRTWPFHSLCSGDLKSFNASIYLEPKSHALIFGGLNDASLTPITLSPLVATGQPCLVETFHSTHLGKLAPLPNLNAMFRNAFHFRSIPVHAFAHSM